MTQNITASPYNAVGDGLTDNLTAIRNCITAAKSLGEDVFVPAGVFAYSGTLTLNGQTMRGVGNASVLFSTNVSNSVVFLTGTGAVISQLRFAGTRPTVRTAPFEAWRVVASGAANFTAQNLIIESAAGAGIGCDNAQTGTIKDCVVTDTLGDAIHLTNKTANVTVLRNTVLRSGDDGIACVSYQAQGGYVNHITASDNTVGDNFGGRCMSVVGGTDILYENNTMFGNPNRAGLYLAQENSFASLGVKNSTFRNNTIRDCGNTAADHWGIMLFSDGFENNDGLTIQRNLVLQSGSVKGIRVFGSFNSNITVDSNIAVSATPTSYGAGTSVTAYSSGTCGRQT